MPDPLTSLSLATSVVQLVDFGFTLVETYDEIMKTGTNKAREQLRLVTRNTDEVCNMILGLEQAGSRRGVDPASLASSCSTNQTYVEPDGTSGVEGLTTSSSGLDVLAYRTQEVAAELAEVLEEVRTPTPQVNSYVQKVWVNYGGHTALQALIKRRKIKSLHCHLLQLRDERNCHMNVLSRWANPWKLRRPFADHA